MPREIDVARLGELLESSGVQLIEVLPAQEYEEEHLSSGELQNMIVR